MTLNEPDRRQIEAWWEEIVRTPTDLPTGVTQVQARLVRVVGRGTLPSGAGVFLKVMGFPRAKDKLRYSLRALPAVHEASILRYLATTEVRVPEVLAAHGIRRRGLPHASLLATRALSVASTELLPDPVLDVVFALRDVGVFHPDLHTDNFVPLDDGAIAVLDMQSARRRRTVQHEDMNRMLATLFAHRAYQGASIEPWCAALRARDYDEQSVGRIQDLAERVNSRARCDWLQRCLKESTQFSVQPGVLHTRYERRAMVDKGEWVEGGEEMFRYWMGDRALEILAGSTPVLAALDRPRRGTSGGHRVRLSGGEAALAEHAERLLGGYQRYREEISRRV